jgi:tetratricopeptide (TPR) repeat protein
MRTFLFILCLLLLPLAQSIAADSKSQASSVQQLNNVQVQLAVLDEKLKQQAKLGTDIKELESTQLNLKIQLSELQAQLVQQEKTQYKQLNGFDGRISDLGITIAFFSLLITAIAIILGFTATNRAVSAAKEHMNKWVKDNKDELITAAKEELKDVSLELQTNAKTLEDEAKKALEQIKAKHERDLQKLMDLSADTVISNDERTSKKLTVNKSSSSKNHYDVNDWFKEGIEAYASQKFEPALTAWDNVLAKLEDDDNPILRAITLLNKGISHGQLNQLDDANKSFDNLIQSFNNSDNEKIQVIFAQAIMNKGITLTKQDKLGDAIQVYENLIDRFNDSESEKSKVIVAKAMFSKAFTLDKYQKSGDEIQVYDNLIERFKDSDNEEVKVIIAHAMHNKGITLRKLNKLDDAIQVYDNLIKRFNNTDNEEVKVIIAHAIYNKGVALSRHDKFDGAIQVYDNLLENFNDPENEKNQVIIAKTMNSKGFSLEKLDKFDDAVQIYNNLIERFNSSDNEEIKVLIAQAMISKSIVLTLQKEVKSAIQTLEELITCFKDSQNDDIKESVRSSLANLAEVSILFEQPENVLLRVTKAESYGLDSLMQAVMSFVRYLLDDINIETLFSSIKAIPSDTELTWQFNEIRDYLNEVKGEKKEVVQAVTAFFEDHKDVQKLQGDLGL